MKRLFNSHGQHIADELDGRLYAPSGSNMGRYIESAKIFVDLNGNYLGEIFYDNRLLARRSSGYRSTNFGNAGTTGSIGSHGSPGNVGSIGTSSEYEDIDLEP